MRRNFDAAHNAQQSNGSNDHACVQNSRKYRAATLLRRKRRQRTRRVQRCLRELRRRDAFGPGWRPHSPLSSVGRMPHRAGLPPSCPCDRMRRSTLSAGATARCRRDAFNAVCGNSADAMRLARDGDPIRLCPLSDECRTQLGFLQAAHAIACVTLCATAMHAQSSRLVTTPLLRYPTPSPSPQPQPPQCDGPATNRRAPYGPIFCGLRWHMTAFGGVCPTRSAFCVCLQPGLTKKCVEFGVQVCQVCVSFNDAFSTLCEIGHRSGCSKTPGTKN